MDYSTWIVLAMIGSVAVGSLISLANRRKQHLEQLLRDHVKEKKEVLVHKARINRLAAQVAAKKQQLGGQTPDEQVVGSEAQSEASTQSSAQSTSV